MSILPTGPVVLLLLALAGLCAAAAAAPGPASWVDRILDVPYPAPQEPAGPVLQLLRQDCEELERNRPILKTPLVIGERRFEHGRHDAPR